MVVWIQFVHVHAVFTLELKSCFVFYTCSAQILSRAMDPMWLRLLLMLSTLRQNVRWGGISKHHDLSPLPPFFIPSLSLLSFLFSPSPPLSLSPLPPSLSFSLFSFFLPPSLLSPYLSHSLCLPPPSYPSPISLVQSFCTTRKHFKWISLRVGNHQLWKNCWTAVHCLTFYFITSSLQYMCKHCLSIKCVCC